MKKIKLFFTILFCLLLMLPGCTSSKFVDFKSESGGFIVKFPGTPKEEKTTANTQAGPIEAISYSVSNNKISYTVAYNDYPEELVKSSKPDDILNGARDGAVTNTKGKLLNELIINLDNYPGRDFRYELSGGIGIVRQRIYLVNNRLYQIMTATESEDMFLNSITEFFDSFRLIK